VLQDDVRRLPEVRKLKDISAMQIQQLRARAEQGQPESQFLLSQICRQDKDLDGMLHWLRLASAKQLPDALDALGHCYERGLGIPRDYAAALAHYDQAVQGGSSAAAFRKGELLYKSQQGPANKSLICDLLVTAAEANFVPALKAIGYLSIQHVSSRNLGLDCLRRAAQGGDPVEQGEKWVVTKWFREKPTKYLEF
jgi:TPR repeat protein